MKDSTTNLTELRKDKSNFTWGKLIKLHEIGDYTIGEYHPRITKGCELTHKINYDEKEYHCWINDEDINISADTLDNALILAIAYKHDGCNSHAGEYFIKMIKQ